jgi:hypothetical protein
MDADFPTMEPRATATQSDRAYLLTSSEFLLDPRRLAVALSRAKRKMTLVASRSVFSLFIPTRTIRAEHGRSFSPKDVFL